MSAKSKSLAAYGDCKTVLDMALQVDGLQYVLSSVGRAVNFKLRCNRYRVLLREVEQEMLAATPGARAEIAYDILLIRQVDAEGESSRQGTIIKFDHHKTEGILRDADGNEIPLPVAGIPIVEQGS